METTSKFLTGVLGGGMASSFLLFIFRGQNKKIDAIEQKKVDISNCKIITKNMDKNMDEIKIDIKDIKKLQTEQLVNITEFKTILTEIKQNMIQQRKGDK